MNHILKNTLGWTVVAKVDGRCQSKDGQGLVVVHGGSVQGWVDGDDVDI